MLKSCFNTFSRWIADHLPLKVIYHAAIRAGCIATSHPWGNTIVCEMTFFQMLARLEQHMEWQKHPLKADPNATDCPHCHVAKDPHMGDCPNCGGPYDQVPQPQIYRAIVHHQPSSSFSTDLPDPTEAMLQDPAFNTIWEIVKNWDVRVPPDMLTGATGNHARQLLEALEPFLCDNRHDV